MKRWEGNIQAVEEIEYAGFLLDAAKEAGIDVERVRDAPFFKGPARRDQDVQVSFPCSDCVALETSMMEESLHLLVYMITSVPSVRPSVCLLPDVRGRAQHPR